MNKDIYITAMEKITASEEFKQNLKNNLNSKSTKKVNNKLIPSGFILAAVLIAIITLPYHILRNNNVSEEFKITGKTSEYTMACYYSVLYYDGYEYSPSEWLSYNPSQGNGSQYEPEKKLGEVILDLKSITYTGTPPDFSSTLDIDTEIYKIKNIKADRAVLVKFSAKEYTVFYRTRKAVPSKESSFNLKLSEIFGMVSDHSIISSVELRSEENGSWLRTSESQDLISLLNHELPGLKLLTYKEFSTKDSTLRIPVNLMFEDGGALPIQFYPYENYASIFGGYVPISEELCNEIKNLYESGSEYPGITDLLPFSEDEISYLYIKDYAKGIELQCKEPLWSGGTLYNLLRYYRVNKIEKIQGTPIISFVMGTSPKDSTVIRFYHSETDNLVINIDNDFYMPVKGSITEADLTNYLLNSTELGLTENQP